MVVNSFKEGKIVTEIFEKQALKRNGTIRRIWIRFPRLTIPYQNTNIVVYFIPIKSGVYTGHMMAQL